MVSISGALGRLRREAVLGARRARNGIKYAAGVKWAADHPTPNDVIWRQDKLTLRRYRGEEPPLIAPPVLAFGGLIRITGIFDLVEGNSFVARALDAGFDPYVLDWGEPDERDAENTLETYLSYYLPRAIDAVRKESGHDEVTIIGYCMGGAMALHALAAKPELPVRNLVLIATPIDFSHLSPFFEALRTGELDPASALDATGNVPASLVYRFFQIRKPTADVVQYVNLWQNLWDDRYVESHQALSRLFGRQVPLPGAVALQVAEQWILNNGLLEDKLRLDGRPASLGAIQIPVLVVTGTKDEMVPDEASRPAIDVLTGTKAELLRLDAGHAGLTVGRTSAKVTIPQILGWLSARGIPSSGIEKG
jgi:polyhydroxyalkanoate synthase